jgi:formyl-CoA transferase
MPESPLDKSVSTEPRLPLNGLTVLDLTLARAGHTAVRHLADWGATVIRIETPASEGEDVAGRRPGFDFQNLHRNKRAITLNLKTPEGHAAFMRLAGTADVILENMRAPVKHRLKVSYEDVKAINPRIVYGSISGFFHFFLYCHCAVFYLIF